MTPLYHRYHILNKQRSQNVRTQLWDSIQKQKGGEGGRLEVEVELSWVPPQVMAQGYQAPVGAVASLGVTMVM